MTALGLLTSIPASASATTNASTAGPSLARSAALQQCLAQWTGALSSAGPETGPFTSAQTAFLEQAARETWTMLSTVDLDPATGLPRDNVPVRGNPTRTDFTSPTAIGLSLDAIVAARDLGLATNSQAGALAAREVQAVQALPKYDGFLYKWYDTSTGRAVSDPNLDPITPADALVSTVDNGWLAQGLLTAGSAFGSIRAATQSLVTAMRWSALLNPTTHLLTTGLLGGVQQPSSYRLSYGGTRIADYMAIASGAVPGSLYWSLTNTPPASVGQRETPVGAVVAHVDPQNGRTYSVDQTHYQFGSTSFVPTFDGSAFEALAPAMVIPDGEVSTTGLGRNDIETVAAQICDATDGLGYPVWGVAPAAAPGTGAGYVEYGLPALSTRRADVSDTATAPDASFMALQIAPQAAVHNLQEMMSLHPAVYREYGFVDSVDPTTGAVAGRYSEVNSAIDLMGVDNALDAGELERYLSASPQGTKLLPYLRADIFSGG